MFIKIRRYAIKSPEPEQWIAYILSYGPLKMTVYFEILIKLALTMIRLEEMLRQIWTCADPESFVRGCPTLTFFFVGFVF